MIELKNVTKDYDGHLALRNLNLTIQNGEIIGLIGHNGAGKSTTIKSLVSVINPTSGQIIVDGQELSANRLAIKKKIGYVADSPDLFLRLTANEFWELVATSYDMNEADCEERLQYLLETFDFADHRYEVIESFSHGMRQKLVLIGALITSPKVLILDEPMVGLDVKTSFNLKNILREFADAGNTVIFSTHVMEVAEKICDKLVIINKGKIAFCGKLSELKTEEHSNEDLEKIFLELTDNEKI